MGFWDDLTENLPFSDLLRVGGRWVTLKNGKRVKLNTEGRIVAGLPEKYSGIHVADFGRVSKEERELLGIDCDELASCHKCEKTFATKDVAFKALLDANPELDALRTSEFGAYDLAFLRWRRGHRKGPKPRTTITDGRLDAINEYYDLRGVNRVASMTEAIYHAIPTNRHWAELEARLAPLEEMAGFKLNLPDEALRLSVGKLDVQQCRDDIDRRISALLERAREGRLEGAEPAGVPF